MVSTWRFPCWGLGSIPGRGARIPQASKCRYLKKKKEPLLEEDLIIELLLPWNFSAVGLCGELPQ